MQVFSMLAPFYVGSSNFTTSPTNPAVNVAGCMAQWKSIDQQFQGGDDGTHSQCSAGERLVGQENDPDSFTPYTVNRPTKIYENGSKIQFVTDLGSYAKGIPGFWAVDPHTFDNPIEFQNKTFGASSRLVNPSSSYDITLEELSSYASANFKAGIFSGNLGVRVIQTTLETLANTTSGITVANGDTTIPDGKVKTESTKTNVLPALNLSASITDEIKIRFAAAKTKQDLDLDRYGSSLGIATTADPSDPGIRIPLNWSSNGNPNLKPWLATNLDLSAEYYFGQASLFSVGAYYIKIDSFVASTHYNRDITVNGKIYNLPGQGPSQGKGGKVKGIELAAKLALSDFTSGFFSDYGLDANYTYSPSETNDPTQVDMAGKFYPFPDNSKNTANLALWYQKDKLQARIALNHRSDRFISDSGQIGYTDQNGDQQTVDGFSTWELGATYVDANISYDVMDNLTVYVEGSNITGTDEKQTYRLKDGVQQDGTVFENEVRYSLGLRAKF
jgi:TonB-dependent receptor